MFPLADCEEDREADQSKGDDGGSWKARMIPPRTGIRYLKNQNLSFDSNLFVTSPHFVSRGACGEEGFWGMSRK